MWLTHTSEETVPGKEVRGLFQALTEGGWGGLIGPTGIYILHGLETHLLVNSLHLRVKTNIL